MLFCPCDFYQEMPCLGVIRRFEEWLLTLTDLIVAGDDSGSETTGLTG